MRSAIAAVVACLLLVTAAAPEAATSEEYSQSNQYTDSYQYPQSYPYPVAPTTSGRNSGVGIGPCTAVMSHWYRISRELHAARQQAGYLAMQIGNSGVADADQALADRSALFEELRALEEAEQDARLAMEICKQNLA